jgi:ceramide glucosyltransferase
VRWARLRRVTFPAHYAPEFMNGSFIAAVLGAYAGLQLGGNATTSIVAATVIIGALHGGELWLAKVCGFPLDWRKPFALLMRDLLLPVMFVDALLFDDFVWHGNAMTVREVEDTAV